MNQIVSTLTQNRHHNPYYLNNRRFLIREINFNTAFNTYQIFPHLDVGC